MVHPSSSAVTGAGSHRGPAGRWSLVGVVILAVGSLGALTLALAAVHARLGLPSIFLLYLTLIVAIALVGGTWLALGSAVIASMLINWFFTPPTHELTIADQQNALGLAVFVMVAAVVSILVDRESRARAMAQRRRSEAESLERVNELKTAILSAVSHDLRTPLASIKASVSSLRDPDVTWSSSETEEFLATIDDAADRLTALVVNLLDMSRIQTGSVVLALGTVGLDEIVPRALSLIPRADDEVDVPESLPRVIVDSALLERAVANVVSNARQWSPQGSRVIVYARTEDERVELHVVDHGPGVPAGDRTRMFLPFQQLSARSDKEGIGLGLAVALGFVEAMGGTIRAEDTPGGGLTMVISFRAAT